MRCQCRWPMVLKSLSIPGPIHVSQDYGKRAQILLFDVLIHGHFVLDVVLICIC